MALTITIGGVTLHGFEIPEHLPVPLKQAVAVNEYAGGTRTLYAQGAFPKPIAWSGMLMGASAFARGATLERIVAAARPVQLAYGPFAWLGLLVEFTLDINHQFRIPYQATFEPSVDLSGIGVVAQGDPSAEQALAGDMAAFDGIDSGVDGIALPTGLVAAAAGVNTSVAAGLLAGGGIVADMPPEQAAAIAAATVLVAAAAAPIWALTNAAAASAALDLAARAAAIRAVVASPTSGPRRLQGVVNPNLFMVAAQYLGDAARWGEIAALSGLAPDPLPSGILTLTVPGR